MDGWRGRDSSRESNSEGGSNQSRHGRETGREGESLHLLPLPLLGAGGRGRGEEIREECRDREGEKEAL